MHLLFKQKLQSVLTKYDINIQFRHTHHKKMIQIKHTQLTNYPYPRFHVINLTLKWFCFGMHINKFVVRTGFCHNALHSLSFTHAPHGVCYGLRTWFHSLTHSPFITLITYFVTSLSLCPNTVFLNLWSMDRPVPWMMLTGPSDG